MRRGVPPQIFMLVLLTLAIVGSYRIARHYLTPPSFGEYGWYRGAALKEIASRTPSYGGRKACDECHSDEIKNAAAAEHKNVSCEACHGASQAHADDPDGHAPIKLTDSLCIRCHEANASRPAWLQQIVVAEHYQSKTGAQHCTDCHQPHQPNEVPEEKKPS